MHARNRSLGYGYSRSNSIGTDGMTPGSRISREGSMRGRGFYNSEYRNHNRGGFGRGQRRNFQSQHSPARKGDVFVEAGRLAVEFLVSKGILPPIALSGKWQISGLKNQVGDFLSGRSPDGERVPLSADARTSAPYRFGNAADQGPGRKRYADDCRSRPGSFKCYGNESNKELERSRSWPNRHRDTNHNQIGKYSDSGMQSSPASEATQKIASIGESESNIGKTKPIDDENMAEDSILSNTEVTEENSLRADVKPDNESCDTIISDVEGGEIRDGRNNDDGQQGDKEGKSLEPCVDMDNQEIKLDNKLLRLSPFANVPTKTRSSLTKSLKIEQDNITEVKDLNMSELLDKPLAHAVNLPVDSSSTDELSNLALNSENIGSDLKEEPAANEDQGFTSFNGQDSCMSPVMFSEKSIRQKLERNDIVPGFQRSGSMLLNSGEKRTQEDYDGWDGTKKPRQQGSSFGSLPDGCLDISNSMRKQHSSEEPIISNLEERSMVMSLFPEGDVACIDFTEEKQLFPGSYKTCDLNLMEVSELSENHNSANSTIVLPPVQESGKQEIPVDIDLSMSNKTLASERFPKCLSSGNDIEVIDLEDDSAQEDKAFNCLERRSDSVFTGLDNFQSNSHDNEVPELQDGYGLMISELLGNDIPNYSAVPPNINSLHDDMDLHSGEGIMGDDDSIYMSFGEIPISFLKAWEQHPSQDYGKPF